MQLRFRMSLSGLPENTFLELDGMTVTLTNAAGVHWDSGWMGQGQLLFAEDKSADLSFELKREILDRLKSAPVSARFFLALTVYNDVGQHQFVVPDGDFVLPDVGRCSIGRGLWSSLHCRMPLRRPSFLLLSSPLATNTCIFGKRELPANAGGMAREIARGWIRSGDTAPAEMGISPIEDSDVYFSRRKASLDSGGNVRICPGTPLTLSHPEAVRRARSELQLDNISLDDYRWNAGVAFGD